MTDPKPLFTAEDFRFPEQAQIDSLAPELAERIREKIAGRANAKRDAEIERLRIALGESEGLRTALEGEEFVKAHRSLAKEAEFYRRERDRVEADNEKLRVENKVLQYTVDQGANDVAQMAAMCNRIVSLEADNARLREALEFYANANWGLDISQETAEGFTNRAYNDRGHRARAALGDRK